MPLLALAVLIAGAVLAGLARRIRLLRSEHEAAIEEIEQSTGAPVRSLAAGLRRVIARSEQAEQRELMMRSAVEHAAEGIAILDPELSVLFATQSTKRMLEGRHGDAAAVAKIRDLARHAFTTDGPAVARVETYVPTRRVLSVRADRLPAHVIDGVSVQVRDISEEERVDAIRQDFVANVSHELKTPVGALSVLAEAISKTEDDVARKRLAGRLVGESERLVALIDDILDLSLVERGQPESSPVDLVSVVREACNRVALLAERSAVEVNVDMPNHPVVVNGDRRQLLSAIGNLLDNAFKHGTAGGEPGAAVEIELSSDDVSAVVAVKDHGIGIAEQHQSRIFERFYRVDRARTRGRGGTGLGLSIVRHIALNHGGDVSVESTLGVGSTFRLSLPVAGS